MRTPFAQRRPYSLQANVRVIQILGFSAFVAAWTVLVLHRKPHPTILAVPQPPSHVSVSPSTNLTPVIVKTLPVVADDKKRSDVVEAKVEDLPPFVDIPSLFDRTLSSQQRSESIATDFIDAILRIEGIYDPTRVGLFGPAFRMQIRPGTMSMSNVFADRWISASRDPNIHYRTRPFAETWLWPSQRDCDGYMRFRPDDLGIFIDRLSAADCAAIKDPVDAYSQIVSAPLSLPVFVAPYPGNRLSSEDFISAQEAHVRAMRERLRLRLQRPA